MRGFKDLEKSEQEEERKKEKLIERKETGVRKENFLHERSRNSM